MGGFTDRLVGGWVCGDKFTVASIWVNIDSGNVLVPFGTKTIPESKLTNHRQDLVAFTRGQICTSGISIAKLLIWYYNRISQRPMNYASCRLVRYITWLTLMLSSSKQRCSFLLHEVAPSSVHIRHHLVGPCELETAITRLLSVIWERQNKAELPGIAGFGYRELLDTRDSNDLFDCDTMGMTN